MELFVRNETFLDIMSLLHVASGLGFGLILFCVLKKMSWQRYFLIMFVFLLIWEFFEAFLRSVEEYYYYLRNFLDFLPDGWFSSETLINILGDMLTGLLGALLIYLIFRKYYFVSKNIK